MGKQQDNLRQKAHGKDVPISQVREGDIVVAEDGLLMVEEVRVNPEGYIFVQGDRRLEVPEGGKVRMVGGLEVPEDGGA